MDSPRKRRVERFAWLSVTIFLLTAVVLVAFSPRALAQNRNDEKRVLLESFQDIFDFVQKNYVDEGKVESRALVEGALKGLFDALGDPYSAYLTGEDLRALEDTTTGEFIGIGVVISKSEGASGAEVVSPIEGTPAYRAGLTAGDLIVKIGEEDVRELSLNDVVNRIRGPKGTPVSLTVQRGKDLVFDVTVERDAVEVPTVKRAMMSGDVGYLRITTFTPRTARLVEEAIRFFDQSSYCALVVDVRSNGGGRLDSVIDIADYFLDTGPIVSTRGRSRAESYTYSAREANTIVKRDLPVAVLIDGGSASASEILAGALKDTKRAVVVGQKSFGKGTVQQVRTFGEFEFKLTMSKYYTPAGVSIDGTGIQPDVEVAEEKFTEAEQESYNRLIREGRIRDFVDGIGASAPPEEPAVAAFMAQLRKDGFDIREPLLRKLVRDQANRTNPNPPVFDLEYDRALQKAVEVLGRGATGAASR
jgi:carboxyl-terminal processing protease